MEETTTVLTRPDQAQAIQTLKDSIKNKAKPTLALARELRQFDTQFNVNQEDLAPQLETNRTHLSLLESTLKWDADVQTNLETRPLSDREIAALNQLNPADRLLVSKEAREGNIALGRIYKRCEDFPKGDNKNVISEKTLITPNNRQKEQYNLDNTREAGVRPNPNVNRGSDPFAPDTPQTHRHPLIRDTINAILRVVVVWAKDSDFGGLAERWINFVQDTGWLKSGLAVMAVGLTAYGAVTFVPLAQSRWNEFWQGRRFEQGGGAPSATAAGQTSGPGFPIRWGATPDHRINLNWDGQGPGVTYRIVRSAPPEHGKEPSWQELIPGKTLEKPGALVEIHRDFGTSWVAVGASAPNDGKISYSQYLIFEPNLINQRNSVEPLAAGPVAPTGGLQTSPPSAAVGGPSKQLAAMDSPPVPAGNDVKVAAAATAPTELHAVVKNPDLIIVSWRPVAPGYRYNVYSSGSRQLTALRKENKEPMSYNEAEWIPETGLDRYWIVATAIDPQGRESGYSEAIEVIRHPGTTANSGALDEAAGVLRKVLPW